MTVSPSTIEDALAARFSDCAAVFNNGATESELNSVERRLSVELPEDFKQFYREANGQKLDELNCGVGTPCIPMMPLGNDSGDFCTWGEFLSLEDIVTATLNNRAIEQFDADNFRDDELELSGPVKMHRNHVVFCDPGSGDVIGLDLSPEVGGRMYQVVALNHDPFGLACIATSFTSFLQLVVSAIQSENYRLEEGTIMHVNCP